MQFLKRMACLPIVIFFIFASPFVSHASTLDQVNFFPGISAIGFYTIDFQQEVVPGISGRLLGVDLYPFPHENSFIFYINKGIGWQSDLHDYSVSVTPNVEYGHPFYIDVASANIILNAGETFVIGIIAEGDRQTLRTTNQNSEPGSYSQGRLFADGSQQHYILGDDLAFRTHMQIIPEPSTLLLICVGGLFFVRRRRPLSYGGVHNLL